MPSSHSSPEAELISLAISLIEKCLVMRDGDQGADYNWIGRDFARESAEIERFSQELPRYLALVYAELFIKVCKTQGLDPLAQWQQQHRLPYFRVGIEAEWTDVLRRDEQRHHDQDDAQDDDGPPQG